MFPSCRMYCCYTCCSWIDTFFSICRYEEYIPVKKRRAIEQQARLALLKRVSLAANERCVLHQGFVHLFGRSIIQCLLTLQAVRKDTATDTLSDTEPQTVQTDVLNAAEPAAPVKTSLLAATAAARKGVPKETDDQKRLKEEQEMLHNITNRTALKTFAELAKARIAPSCM